MKVVARLAFSLESADLIYNGQQMLARHDSINSMNEKETRIL